MKKNIFKLALLAISFYFVANSVSASEEATSALPCNTNRAKFDCADGVHCYYTGQQDFCSGN